MSEMEFTNRSLQADLKYRLVRRELRKIAATLLLVNDR